MRTVDPARHQTRRDAILNAAEAALTRAGLHGASMAVICREAGMSPGHVYHYFDDKDAILAALSARVLAAALARFDVGFEDDPIGAIKAFFDRARSQSSPGRRGFVLDLYAEAYRNPRVGQIVTDHSDRLRQLFAERLAGARARGLIPASIDTQASAAALVMLLDGSKFLAIRQPHWSDDQARAYTHRLIDALLVAPQVADHGQSS